MIRVARLMGLLRESHTSGDMLRKRHFPASLRRMPWSLQAVSETGNLDVSMVTLGIQVNAAVLPQETVIG